MIDINKNAQLDIIYAQPDNNTCVCATRYTQTRAISSCCCCRSESVSQPSHYSCSHSLVRSYDRRGCRCGCYDAEWPRPLAAATVAVVMQAVLQISRPRRARRRAAPAQTICARARSCAHSQRARSVRSVQFGPIRFAACTHAGGRWPAQWHNVLLVVVMQTSPKRAGRSVPR